MNDRIEAAWPGRATGWPALAWMAALVAAGLVFTLGFACATPLAGIGAVAALTLPRREAFAAVAAAWLANQMAGFLLLNYPPTANAFEWGGAIGLAAMLSTVAARIAAAAASSVALRPVAAFAAAFAAFEAALFAVSLAALGGLGAYTPAIVARILAINACAAAVLLAVRAIAATLAPAAASARRVTPA